MKTAMMAGTQRIVGILGAFLVAVVLPLRIAYADSQDMSSFLTC